MGCYEQMASTVSLTVGNVLCSFVMIFMAYKLRTSRSVVAGSILLSEVSGAAATSMKLGVVVTQGGRIFIDLAFASVMGLVVLFLMSLVLYLHVRIFDSQERGILRNKLRLRLLDHRRSNDKNGYSATRTKLNELDRLVDIAKKALVAGGSLDECHDDVVRVARAELKIESNPLIKIWICLMARADHFELYVSNSGKGSWIDQIFGEPLITAYVGSDAPTEEELKTSVDIAVEGIPSNATMSVENNVDQETADIIRRHVKVIRNIDVVVPVTSPVRRLRKMVYGSVKVKQKKVRRIRPDLGKAIPDTTDGLDANNVQNGKIDQGRSGRNEDSKILDREVPKSGLAMAGGTDDARPDGGGGNHTRTVPPGEQPAGFGPGKEFSGVATVT